MTEKISNFPLLTAVVTPFSDSLKIDLESLDQVMREQIAAKNGVVYLGSTGEGPNITSTEKKELALAFKQYQGQVPVIAGVEGQKLGEQLEWISFLKSLGTDGLLIPTPLYSKPGRYGQTEWFSALLDAAGIPCILYNTPSRSGVPLAVETVKDLAGHPSFFGVKESSGSVEEMRRYKEVMGEKFLYCGDDLLFPSFARAGARGLVSVASNAWAKESRRYAELCLAEDLRPEDLSLWEEASSTLFLASNPLPVKALLKELGLISSAATRPPLSSRDLLENPDNLRELLSVNKKIMDWGKKYE